MNKDKCKRLLAQYFSARRRNKNQDIDFLTVDFVKYVALENKLEDMHSTAFIVLSKILNGLYDSPEVLQEAFDLAKEVEGKENAMRI